MSCVSPLDDCSLLNWLDAGRALMNEGRFYRPNVLAEADRPSMYEGRLYRPNVLVETDQPPMNEGRFYRPTLFAPPLWGKPGNCHQNLSSEPHKWSTLPSPHGEAIDNLERSNNKLQSTFDRLSTAMPETSKHDLPFVPWPAYGMEIFDNAEDSTSDIFAPFRGSFVPIDLVEASDQQSLDIPCCSPLHMRADPCPSDEEDQSTPQPKIQLPFWAKKPRGDKEAEGSTGHHIGTCKPCAWFHRPESCMYGDACNFCHLCPEGEIKRRRRIKIKYLRAREKGFSPQLTNPLDPRRLTPDAPKTLRRVVSSSLF